MADFLCIFKYIFLRLFCGPIHDKYVSQISRCQGKLASGVILPKKSRSLEMSMVTLKANLKAKCSISCLVGHLLRMFCQYSRDRHLPKLLSSEIVFSGWICKHFRSPGKVHGYPKSPLQIKYCSPISCIFLGRVVFRLFFCVHQPMTDTTSEFHNDRWNRFSRAEFSKTVCLQMLTFASCCCSGRPRWTTAAAAVQWHQRRRGYSRHVSYWCRTALNSPPDSRIRLKPGLMSVWWEITSSRITTHAKVMRTISIFRLTRSSLGLPSSILWLS